jgi:hypothetical protein
MPRVLVRTLLLSLALLCAATLAPTAFASGGGPASRFAAASDSTVAAQRIAVEHWGVNPCGGNVSIAWTAQAADINAVAHWSSLVPDTGPATHRDCVITFNRRGTFSWAKFCTVVTHEYGHLIGLSHSSDPDDVMAPVYRTPLPACLAARR